MNKKIKEMTGEEWEALSRSIMAMFLIKGKGDVYKLSKQMLTALEQIGIKEVISANLNFQTTAMGVYSLTFWQFIGSFQLSGGLRKVSPLELTAEGLEECKEIVRDSFSKSNRLSKMIEEIAKLIKLDLSKIKIPQYPPLVGPHPIFKFGPSPR